MNTSGSPGGNATSFHAASGRAGGGNAEDRQGEGAEPAVPTIIPKDLLGMAFRNLGRHRAKTVITTIAVAVSVALYIIMDGWLLGMNLESRRNIVSYEMGAAKIQTEAYFRRKDELPMYEGFSGWRELAEALEAGGYASAPRFVFTGTLYSPNASAPLVFNGVDPAREAGLLRYTGHLESGRFPLPGRAEIAVGTMAAEKLKVGIPQRPTRSEFESLLLSAAKDEEEAAFMRSLYLAQEPGSGKKGSRPFTVESALPEEARLLLRKDASKDQLTRIWSILEASGRMSVRISTVIDLKALPETVRRDKFELELLPCLDEASRALALASYRADPPEGDYRLLETEAGKREALLKAMLDADFPGALRHVNQLIDATVVGVINSPNPKTNANVGFMPLDSLEGENGLMLDGRVTELLVRKAGADDARLPGGDESPEAISKAVSSILSSRPEGLAVRGWEDYAADYLAASAGDNISTRVMIVLLFILSFIGISNTMLMAILERGKETGMLRALGMRDGEILLAYAFEAGLVGALGSLAGIALGCLVNIPMVSQGIDYSAIAEEMGGDFGYRVTAYFRSAWNLPVIVGSGIAATILSSLAALPPALRSLRMPVTESLRFE